MPNRSQSSPGRSIRAHPCCSCNGRNARCKFCACAKAGRACTCCLPAKHGKCCNRFSHHSASTTATVPSNHLPGSTTRSPDTEQLESLQPTLQQLQASIETMAPALSSELPSSLPSRRSCVNCYPGRRGNCANAPAPPNVIIQSTSHLPPLHPMTQPSSTVLPPTSPPAHTVSSLPTSPQPCNPSALSQRPPVESRQNPPDPSPLSTSAPPVTPIRKQCTIEGCTALIAPSMWRIHMSLHASGALPGQVPAEWLLDQNLFVCPNCSQLVANTRQASHLQRCSQRLTDQTAHLQSPIAPEPQINLSLPTFEEVCQLHHPTLRFVPTKARPAFARALSSALKEVLLHNSEEAWLKLFMLPKCVLPSLKQRSVVNPHTPIESLCKMWLNNDLVTLWSMSVTRANLHNSSKNLRTSTHSQEISSAISLGRSGLMGKACRMLLSSGIAPSNSATWNLLQSKNPSCPHPTIPDVASNPVTLGPSFDILRILRSFTKGTSAGPSDLSIQHILDAASIPLQTPICDSLKGVVNILASGKAPKSVSAFLSGGRLIALNKGKISEGRYTDIRPIVVGETLRRLTGTCLCSILRDKFSTFFQPSQFGVACKAGVEKVVHKLRKCIDDGWMSGDFVVCKVDMSNAFNRVSRQAVLDECSSFFPELLPWVSWCYGSHSILWHSMGKISSQSGVQQGDPLGPMLFALVLHKLVSSIEADDDCIDLRFNAWYLDDGILAGERSAVVRALHLIEELGPHLGLFINYPKCEVFSRNGCSLFPASVKSSFLPNLEILGAPIGDLVHCSRFFAEKHNLFKVLLRAISDVAAVDLHVAISLLRKCGGYCKLVHLARTTPTILCEDSLKFFDEEVRLCLSSCVAIDVPDPQWQQAQLSPKRGGLGLRSLSLHSCAAFISSLASLEMGNPDNIHLQQAILRFNARVSPQDSITMESVLNSPPQQKSLSQMLDSFAFHSLLSSASPVNKARMLSVSSPHASSWITAIPSTRLKMHLESAEFQMAIRWWLGLKTSDASPCPFCPDLILDPLGHHATSCRHGGDVVIRHNHLRDIVADFCRQAHLSVRVEAGYGLSSDHSNTRPADVLVQGWDRGSPAALDITVTSPLTPATLRDASSTAGAAAYAAECRKHTANDAKCQELGWACIPLAVETFGNWGMEAQGVFSRLASALGMHQGTSKSWALHTIYSRLNMSLVRSVARSILGRSYVV